MPASRLNASEAKEKRPGLRLSLGFWSVLDAPAHDTPADWASGCRIISSRFSSRPGAWLHATAPYLEKILQTLGDGEYRRVMFMAASQVGKSEVMVNLACWAIDCNPCAMMIVQPTQDDCRSWSRGRLRDAFESTPSIAAKMPRRGTKDGRATTLEMQFPGGALYLAHAGSASALASKPIKILMMDEVDRYPATSGGGILTGEGSPVALAEARTQTYTDAIVLGVSSPSIRGRSRIEAEYKQGTQHQWWCACAECGHTSCWAWADVKYENKEPESAKLLCRGCGVLHDQQAVDAMSAAGKWVAGTDAPVRSDTASFAIWSIHSPVITMAELVRKWLAAKDNPFELQVFTNTVLNQTWEELEAAINFAAVTKLATAHTADSLPDDILVITLTVDIQSNRVEYGVAGWGEFEQHIAIEHKVVRGDPTWKTTWQPIIDLIANREFTTTGGYKLKVTGVGVDLGYLQESGVSALQAFQAVLRKRGGVAFGLRGSSDAQSPIVGNKYAAKPRKDGSRTPTYRRSFYIGTNAIKDLIQMRIPMATEKGGWRWCTGFSEAYFKQFTSERRRLKQGRDKKVRGVWEKHTKNARNEALDLAVYGYAVMRLLKPNWEALKPELLQKPTAQGKVEAVKKPQAPPPVPPPPRRRRQRSASELNAIRRRRR